MICKNCGNYIPYNSTVCPNCGAPVESRGGTGPTGPTGSMGPTDLRKYGEYADPPPKQQGIGFAVASMVCGIVGLLLACCLPIAPLVLAILAVAFGEVTLKNKRPGKGMAIAGLVCGIVAILPQLYILFSGAAFVSGINELIDELNTAYYYM